MKIAIDTSAVTRGDIDFSPFSALGEVVFFNEPSREELFALAKDCGAIIVNKVVVDVALIAACPRLEYVGVFATGYNTVDINACARRGVTVCNVPSYSTDAVAQHVFALLLCKAGSVVEYSSSVNRGDWVKSKAFCYLDYPTYELAGKTFGVFGYGNIGSRVAAIAEAFGMKVKVYSRSFHAECPYPQVARDELFALSDVVSLHCPLTEETENMINAESLKGFKRGAILVNAARGGLVDERAVKAALDSGLLGAYLADVVKEEPMRADNPLLNAENCLITPHVAWIPVETRRRLVKIAAENLKAYLCGKPQNKVN